MAGDASARVPPAAVPPPARARWRVAPRPPGSAVGRGCRVSHQLAASRTSRADAGVASVATAATVSGAAGRAATPGPAAAAGDASTRTAGASPLHRRHTGCRLLARRAAATPVDRETAASAGCRPAARAGAADDRPGVRRRRRRPGELADRWQPAVSPAVALAAPRWCAAELPGPGAAGGSRAVRRRRCSAAEPAVADVLARFDADRPRLRHRLLGWAQDGHDSMQRVCRLAASGVYIGAGAAAAGA